MSGEANTPRDGLFSHNGEWHAFTLGIAVGMALLVPSPNFRRLVWFAIGLETLEAEKRSKALREIREESWYAMGGVVCGVLLTVVLVYVALWVVIYTIL